MPFSKKYREDEIEMDVAAYDLDRPDSQAKILWARGLTRLQNQVKFFAQHKTYSNLMQQSNYIEKKLEILLETLEFDDKKKLYILKESYSTAK